MMSIKVVHKSNDLPQEMSQKDLVDFLYEHLGRFRDTPSAINKAIDYAFSTQREKGGFLILAFWDDKLCGVLIVNKTGMEEYIPENILVYIATDKSKRNMGIGSIMLKKALEISEGDMALHVEYDNPAKHLYERFGFTTKYAEMRWLREK